MTPEMIEEIEADLIDHTGGWCCRITQDVSETSPDRPGAQAFGVMIVDLHGNALTVECRIADDGTAQVIATKHVGDGEQIDPSVFTLNGVVMITT